jgi:hypothetical protein
MNFTIAKCSGNHSSTDLEPWEIDTKSLVNSSNELIKPVIGSKDGSYFLRCNGTHRSNAGTDDIAHILILDGDSRISDDGEIVSGAPRPLEVSKVLTKLGVTHCIYSSYSNAATQEEITAKGTDSGGVHGKDYYKYRVIIPCTYTPEQLPSLLDYIFNELHSDGVMLENVKENRTWSQPWYFPRTPDADRLDLFESYQYAGSTILNADVIHSQWEKSQPPRVEPKQNPDKVKIDESNGRINSMKVFNQTFSVHDILSCNGYIKKGHKWLRPDSESKIPSVQLCTQCNDGKERIYSHGGDILNDTYAHDAWDCYRFLELNDTGAKPSAKAFDWNMGIQKHNNNIFGQEQAAKKAQQPPTPRPAQDNYMDENIDCSSMPPEPPLQIPVSTFNHTLDTEHRYCSVDLLRKIDDDHILKRLCIQVAAETHLPVNTVFLMGLTVFSSIASRKYAVKYQNGEHIPIGLYSVVEQPSGTGKSWCLGTFQKPFIAIQKELLKEVLKKIKDFEKRTGSGEELTDDEQTELKELGQKRKHLSTGLFVTNSTPEALEMTLNRTNGFFSAVSSEQGLFNSLLGNSYKSEKNANNNDVMLNGFDGGHVNSIRVSREGYNGNVIGGVACFAQQGSIEVVLKSSNGTGLSERFLMLAEPHSLGKRDHTKQIQPDPMLSVNYANHCDLMKSVINDPLTLDELNNLFISNEGFLKINQYRNKIEPDLVDGGKFSHVSLRGAASKINMQIMKIAANLHLLNYDMQSEIPERHVIAAIDIANELLEANLKLCKDKGIMGVKAEFTAILSLFENDQRPRTERNIIMSKSQKIPFKDFSGNKSDLIKTTLREMVEQRLLAKTLDATGKALYMLAQ